MMLIFELACSLQPEAGMNPLLEQIEGQAVPQEPQRPMSRRESDIVLANLKMLEDAWVFVLQTQEAAETLLKRLTNIQIIAEEIADQQEPSPEDLETAWAKIKLLSHQCDTLVRHPIVDDVAPLLGGTFRLNNELTLEVPNLSAHEEGLELLTHAHETRIIVGPGGVIQSASLSEPRAHVIPADDYEEEEIDEEAQEAQAIAMEPGEYIAEVEHVSSDDVTIKIFDAVSRKLLDEVTEIELAKAGPTEILFENGLILIVESPSTLGTIDIGLSTRQSLEIRIEAGLNLQSIDGWLYPDAQARHFELHALYIETPLEKVREGIEKIVAARIELNDSFDDILGDYESFALHPEILGHRLQPGAQAWNALDRAGLTRSFNETQTHPQNAARHYMQQLRETVGTPELLLRILERVAWHITENQLIPAVRQLQSLRHSLHFEDTLYVMPTSLLLHFTSITQAVLAGELECAHERLSVLIDICSKTRPQLINSGYSKDHLN